VCELHSPGCQEEEYCMLAQSVILIIDADIGVDTQKQTRPDESHSTGTVVGLHQNRTV
jgi:hypothetical protein